jgi:glycosyltransferase A (GT-A) superfamily protein (DUF2064 family)
VPPALIVLVDAGTNADELAVALDTARRTGGVARVLLFHPADIEADLARRTLGFRLWPQEGATPGERFANAFRQAVELGYDGAVVLHGRAGHRLEPSVITSAAAALGELMGAVVPGEDGAVALLALQQPEPALLAGDDVPSYDDVVRRAGQLRVRLAELSSSSATQPGR